MTHDEIMKLGERELYERVVEWLEFGPPVGRSLEAVSNISKALLLCYQAEEKLDLMRLKRERGRILWELLYSEGCGVRVDDQGFPIAMWSHIASLTKVHPKQRAQAILMTIEDTKTGGG